MLQVSYFVFIGIVGLAHGIYIVNSLGVGKDLVGSKHLVLITGCESFGTGLGGFIAPPITSKFNFGVKPNIRSEERRVGKECRSRWSPYH